MPFGSSQWMYSSGFYPTEIDQSLRFNDDDSAYLSRTPASAGTETTYTLSMWFKYGNIKDMMLFGAGSSTSNQTYIRLYGSASQAILWETDTGATTDWYVQTNALLRDPSAWYHLVFVFDNSLSGITNKAKIYINGELASIAGSSGDYPSGYVNAEVPHYIGTHAGSSLYTDGYLADTYFVDGTALDPTSFGEFKNGVWIPKRYTGSYGTNGFHLEYNDNANDSSGTGNNWTATNIVAGDYMLDSPTNNYATLNAIRPSTATLTDGNLKLTATTAAAWANRLSTIGMSEGKWYCEYTVNVAISPHLIGITDGDIPSANYVGQSSGSWGYYGAGDVYNNGVVLGSPSVASYTAGDLIGFAFDADVGALEFFKNGASQGSVTSIPSGEYFFAFSCTSISSAGTVNFGQSGFTYTPPAGFLALSTANLPEPSISPLYGDSPQDHFNTVLYTGTGAALSITDVGFQPDLVWSKARNTGTPWHQLTDSVRGTTKQLFSNEVDAEDTNADKLTSFDSDGFTLGSNGGINGSGDTYVAWNWKASNATAVSNTEGTITSQVSANTTAGFSIVSFTGPVSSSTVGHGLGVAPSMIILKNRDIGTAGYVWLVYHQSLGNTKAVFLNTTAAETANTQYWLNTTPTSTVFSVGSAIITGAEKMIAYCFSEVEGYSKFGSYTGNGSADGTFVYTGFRPAFVMIKRTDSTANWHIKDTERDPYNFMERYLNANDSAAEGSGVSSLYVDYLSNGFKLRGTSTTINPSGGTLIYMAFAENPFKYANAR
jgi:hypothetical protein